MIAVHGAAYAFDAQRCHYEILVCPQKNPAHGNGLRTIDVPPSYL